MQKSIFSPEYKLLISLMRAERETRGLSQDLVAERVGITASQLSKWERRERRVDLRELRLYCAAIDIPLQTLIGAWEAALTLDQEPDSEI